MNAERADEASQILLPACICEIARRSHSKRKHVLRLIATDAPEAVQLLQLAIGGDHTAERSNMLEQRRVQLLTNSSIDVAQVGGAQREPDGCRGDN